MQEQPLINARKSSRDPDIKGTCLLLVNPGEASYGATITKKRGGTLHQFFHATLMSFTHEKTVSHWAGPCVGSPMAVMTVEKLIALGMQKLIVFGWCGSLSPEMVIGDLFLPEFGVSDEGVSRHYPLQEQPAVSSTLSNELRGLFPTVQQGPIWTTDAPFREFPADIIHHAEKGIKAVDMEFTALCTVCNFYKIEMAGLMVVSDELHHDTWKSGIGSKGFKQRAKTTLNTLMDHLPQ
ncbi:MAG: nucleoside phosphorylase [Desulfobulbaceae bacterium]|jgi:uridine phosphorylase|nr:nucleoside phosphorylase [Desulfobulbaceae bacterium]